MALNKTKIKADLKTADDFAAAQMKAISDDFIAGNINEAERDSKVDKVNDERRGKVADVIINAIKSGDVKAGITVQVDPNSGAGATTGTGKII